MRLTAFIIASLRNTVRCSESISLRPNLRARRSAALRMPLRTKSGAVSRRFQASSLHEMGESGASQMAVRPASPPMRPIICCLNSVRMSSVISRYPSSRAFFSARRLTMPRKNTGARSMRLRAPSVQAISEALAASWVLVSGSATRGSLFVDDFLELLAGLEERHALGRHGDRRAGLRVAPLLHAAIAQTEAAEAADLDLVPFGQGRADPVEDRVDHDFSLPLGQRRDLLGQLLDELHFRHGFSS